MNKGRVFKGRLFKGRVYKKRANIVRVYLG